MGRLERFYDYLKEPIINVEQNKVPFEILKELVYLFAFVFILEILVLFPMLGVMGVENFPHAMDALSESMSTLQLAFLAIIVAPVIEEFLFRFPLKSPILLEFFKAMFFGLSIGLVVGSFYSDGAKLAGILSFVVLFLNYLRIRNIKGEDSHVVRYYPFYFYMMAILFAFIHIFNFDLSVIKWWMGPILVAPQFLLALLLGYVRVKFGLVYSIFLHGLNNTIPIILMNFVDTAI